MSAPANPLLSAALRFAGRGWPVFPCSREKKPMVKGWPDAASTDPNQIEAWWAKWPGASIGAPTGPGMGSTGAWVLDVDVPEKPGDPDGRETLAALEARHGPLPATVEQRTGGGGRQLFWRWPEGREVRNTAGERGKLGPGLDVRGAGGYVILPPSGHPSGGSYAWSGNGAGLADAPEWLLDLVAPLPRQDSPKPSTPSSAPCAAGSSAYGRKALKEEAAKVAGTGQGGRNHALNQAAFVVGQLVAGGELDLGEAESALLAAAGQCGLPDGEARQTIASGFKAGEKEPRKAPEKAGKRTKAAPPAGPSSFVVKPDGVYFRADDDLERVCSPLAVLAMTRDGEGREWGRLLEIVDGDGTAHRWALPMGMLAGDGNDYRRELLSMGLRLASGMKAKNRLHDFLTISNPDARARCVSRVGWHGRRFVLPDAVYGPQDGEEVILQGGPADHAFRVAGSLEDWQEAIGRYCPGNSRLVLAVSAALAAPLLALAGAESGGFHLVGGSSTGKTTALRVAGSVCGGGGLNGYLRQWRATDNALESVSSGACDCLLTLDELGQADAKTAGAVAYMLTNGQGKARSRRDGTARKPQEWRTLFLSTGEITLADKVREDGRGRAMAGQAVRVVDLQADAGAGLGLFEDFHGFESAHAFARHLNEAVGRFYGSPLRAFLERLTSQHGEAAQAAPALIRSFVDEVCPPDADGQVKRVAGRFGLVAAAGEFGVALDVLPWPKDEARQSAARCFRDWLTARGGAGPAEVTAGLAQVRQFFQAHGAARFETWGEAADVSRTNQRAGFRRKDEVSGEWSFYVFQDVFKAEVCQGHNAGMILRELKARGLLLVQDSEHLTVKPRIPGVGSGTRFYHIAPGITGDSVQPRALQKTPGTTGNTGDTLSRLYPHVPGSGNATGDTGDKSSPEPGVVPGCPRSLESYRGRPEASNDAMSPVVPGVPGQNVEGEKKQQLQRQSRVVI